MPSSSHNNLTIEVMRDPGMRHVVTPANDWKDKPNYEFPWHYSVYLPDHRGLEDGQVLRVAGFASSRWSAHAEVLDLKVNGAWWL